MKKIAILSSTGGTNFQSFVDAKQNGQLEGVEISCLIADRECGAVERAKKANIPFHVVSESDREVLDAKMLEILQQYGVDLVVLGGYMRILGSEFVQQYEGRILNVHPSLLPKFAGGMNLYVHQAVLDAP